MKFTKSYIKSIIMEELARLDETEQQDINNIVDSIMKSNPGMSKEEAVRLYHAQSSIDQASANNNRPSDNTVRTVTAPLSSNTKNIFKKNNPTLRVS